MIGLILRHRPYDSGGQRISVETCKDEGKPENRGAVWWLESGDVAKFVNEA